MSFHRGALGSEVVFQSPWLGCLVGRWKVSGGIMPSQPVLVAIVLSPSAQRWRVGPLVECHDRWGDLHCFPVYLKEDDDRMAAVGSDGSPLMLREGFQNETAKSLRVCQAFAQARDRSQRAGPVSFSPCTRSEHYSDYTSHTKAGHGHISPTPRPKQHQ